MKKEYIILLLIIAALGGYLFMKQTDKTHYTLPDLAVIKSNVITGIELNGPKGQITFSKDDDQWVVTDNKYKADQGKVDEMLDAIRHLKATALVSQTEDRNRYHLDKAQRIAVSATSSKGLEREFFLGKEAPTFNHTFISLADDSHVYHAKGSFKRHFDKDLMEYRDKTVFTVNEKEISTLALTKEGISKTLTRTVKNSASEVKTDSKTGGANAAENADKEEKPVWTISEGSLANPDFADSIAGNLVKVECDNFLDDAKKQELEEKDPLFTIMLNTTDYLKVYEKTDDSKYPALSSTSLEAFELSSRTGENFISDIDKILEIKKDEENQ